MISDLCRVPEYGEVVKRGYDERLPVRLISESRRSKTALGGQPLDIYRREVKAVISGAGIELSKSREELTSVPHELHGDESES